VAQLQPIVKLRNLSHGQRIDSPVTMASIALYLGESGQHFCRGLAMGYVFGVMIVLTSMPVSVAWADDAPVFDLGVELAGRSDYMDSGLTNSDHHPSAGITLTPSYGIFYGTIYGATIDYGTDDPKIESRFAIGATPEFGALAVDFNLARRIKFDDPTADRWLPYVTGTYTFNDNFNASLGGGYYLYDDPETADFWEAYAGATVTLDNGIYLTGEAYWEPDSDGAGNAYYAVYGTLGVPFKERFEAIGKLGFEGYEDEASTPSYLWYEAGLNYSVNDHLAFGVAYHGNDLSSTDCTLQAYTDCNHAVFATMTVKAAISNLPK
jgi:hypothetical protein